MHDAANENITQNMSGERFVALIAESQLVLTGYLRTLLRNQADVSDVLQEANLVLWRKRDEYDPERPFHNWACKIALNQSRAYIKSKSRDKHQVMSEQVLKSVAKAALQQVVNPGTDHTHTAHSKVNE